MKLALYSGGHPFENKELDRAVLKLACKRPKMVYIPSSSYMCDVDFRDFVSQYKKFNIERFINFPIDVPVSEVLRNEVLNSDIIHLSGGNTYYFLHHLRRTKLLGDLKKYVKKGGVLTGLSAGAILMTKHIGAAGFPAFDRDENYSGIKNFDALNLIDFEFFPHYKNSKRYFEEMTKYTWESDRPLYACRDGSGIIVKNEEVHFYGQVRCFISGKSFKVS